MKIKEGKDKIGPQIWCMVSHGDVLCEVISQTFHRKFLKNLFGFAVQFTLSLLISPSL